LLLLVRELLCMLRLQLALRSLLEQLLLKLLKHPGVLLSLPRIEGLLRAPCGRQLGWRRRRGAR
tara:strand:+ start:2275 stop:2466 length:192 start_codon:yes stop_codon:yes gene_type:complete